MKASLAVSAIALLCLAGNAFGQSTQAQITGTVTDPTGAAVPAAKVTLANLATQVVYLGETNELGIYRFQNLPPGEYRVEVEAAGFKKVTQSPVVLLVGDVRPLDVRLEVGDVAETIEVSATAVAVESETASMGDVITGRAVTEIPLGLKDSFQLVYLAPGITRGRVGATSSQPDERLQSRTDFKIGGGRDFAQEILLDGVPNSGVDFGAAAYVPNPSMTAEFRVYTNSFSAEYGRTTGGVVDMVTKSGTSEFHGGAYEYYRSKAFDANNFFNNRSGTPKPSLVRHQFGAFVGGPVPYKHSFHKTFFFVSYEGLRLSKPQSGQLSVPTEEHRRGDFSQTLNPKGDLVRIYDPLALVQDPSGDWIRSPFPGNVIPQDRWDPVAGNAMNLYPQPNLPGDPVTRIQNYGFSGSSRVNVDNVSVRGDHNFGASNRLFARYSRIRYDRPPFLPFQAFRIDNQFDVGLQATARDTHTFSPTLVGEVSVGYTRHYTSAFCGGNGFDVTTLGFSADLKNFGFPCVPQFNVSGMSGIGRDRFYRQARVTKSFSGSLSKQWGRHFIKVGVEHRRYTFGHRRNLNSTGNFSFNRGFTQGPDPFQARSDAGFGFASFLLGMGSSGSIYKETPVSIERLYDVAYIQDDWKITPRLTLNLGLRWELNRGMREWHDRLAGLDLDTRSPLSDEVGFELRGVLSWRGQGNPRDLTNLDWNDFGPRIGLAYRLDDQTAIRVGYGIFYTPLIAINGVGTQGIETRTPWVTTIDGGLTPETVLSDPFPLGFNVPNFDRDPLEQVGFRLTSQLPDDRTGYTQQWNFSIQRQFGKDILVDVAYVGNKGTKLPWGDNWEENYMPNRYLDLPPGERNKKVANPFYGVITDPASRLSRKKVAQNQLWRAYPQYTGVRRSYVNAASSIYHSAQFKIVKRAGKGLHLIASYTISKQIDDSSVMRGWLDQNAGGINNYENRRLERSISSMDTPQRLSVGYVYDLPFGRGQRWGNDWSRPLDAVLGGWQVSGLTILQSGRPIGINRRTLNNGESAKLEKPTIDRWFKTEVFSVPPTTGIISLGNVGRLLPDVRADGETNFDITVSKRFVFTEDIYMQIRAEFLNAFNTPQFFFPGNNPRNLRTFGVVTRTANFPRSIQFGALFNF